MKIVDAHHHLWSPSRDPHKVGYVWLKKRGDPKPFGDPTPIQRDYELAEFRSEYYNIVGSVHVQSDGQIQFPERETSYVEECASKANFLLGIVGFVDLSSSQAEAAIERHRAASKCFCGVRQILSRLTSKPNISFAVVDYIKDDLWRDQFALLADGKLSFDLQLYPEQMKEVAVFLAKHDDVQVIIDHAGSPYDMSYRGRKLWLDGMERLGEMPQVSVKVSGFGMFHRMWDRDHLCFVVENLQKIFGKDRIMFGSNFPVDKLMRSYKDIVSDLEPFFSGADKTSFFASNAERIYRLGA